MRPALTRAQLERLNGGPLPLLLVSSPRYVTYKTRSIGFTRAETFYVIDSPETAVELRGGSLENWQRFFDEYGPRRTVLTGTDRQIEALEAEQARRQRALEVVGRRREAIARGLLDGAIGRWLEAS